MDFKSGEIRAAKSKSKWRLWWIFLSLVTCRAVLGTLRCISIFSSPDRIPVDEIPLVLNQMLYWAAVNICYTIFYGNLDATTSVFNSLLQAPVRRTTWRNLTLQEVVVLLVLPVNVFIIAVLYAAILALQPMAVYNFFSAINPTWQTVPVLIAIVFTEVFIALYIFATLTMMAHIMLLFFQKCIEETQSMLKIIGSRLILTESLNVVAIEGALKSLRHLQLLTLVYNGGYRFIHFITKVSTLLWYITMTAFGILAIHSNPFMSCAYLFFGFELASFYCIMFHKAFAVPMLTRKVKSKLSSVVKSATNGDQRRVYLKLIRSIPPLGIKVGNFHSFERMSTPNYLAFGVKNITRIVIAYRSK